MDSKTPIKPHYVTPEPNARLTLYEGPGSLEDEFGRRTAGEAVVELAWLPSPRVAFRVESEGDSGIRPGIPAKLLLDGHAGMELMAEVTQHMISGLGRGQFTETTSGVADGERFLGAMDYIVFHVANFPHFSGSLLERDDDEGKRAWSGRLRWSTETWELVLDELEGVSSSDGLRKQLDGAGGFAITHVGRIRRQDGASIGKSEADSLLGAVSRFLSFVGGVRNTVCLPVGIDEGKREVAWEFWRGPVVEQWRGRRSCFPDLVVEGGHGRAPQLEPVFRRFMESWEDPQWRELLAVGVGFYGTANAHHSLETIIMLAQAGLELASWSLLVPSRLSKKGFAALDAADRLRLLLSEARVPLNLPVALSLTWQDSHLAITGRTVPRP